MEKKKKKTTKNEKTLKIIPTPTKIIPNQSRKQRACGA
jgi:hypothetical protein